MDEQGLKNLYTPFEQANASIAGKYGGTGLGMSITQNLVSLMGGHIKVKSKPNEGTAFTVELPFEQSNVDLQPLQEYVLESLKVLVVDDERDICEHTVLLLKKMKINAEWVLSGKEAVESVVLAQNNGNSFDICFIDWKMPEMDGLETVRQIREKIGPDTPIIIISAYDWSDIAEEARSMGVNAFIAKPMFQSSIYNVLVNVTHGAVSYTHLDVYKRQVYAYITLIGIGSGTIMVIFPGMIFLLPLIYAIVTTLLCFLLVITSSYSIACIYVHYRNGIFSLKKTILHVILQVIFFIDVIDYIYLFFNIRKCRKELIDFA